MSEQGVRGPQAPEKNGCSQGANRIIRTLQRKQAVLKWRLAGSDRLSSACIFYSRCPGSHCSRWQCRGRGRRSRRPKPRKYEFSNSARAPAGGGGHWQLASVDLFGVREQFQDRAQAVLTEAKAAFPCLHYLIQDTCSLCVALRFLRCLLWHCTGSAASGTAV
jgi:hypothetical protein